MIRNRDFCYPKSYCPSQNTFAKMQTQDLNAKKPKPKKFRPKNLKLASKKTFALPYINKLEKIFY